MRRQYKTKCKILRKGQTNKRSYEKKESEIINRIARDSAKLKRMQKGEVRKMRK